MKAIIEFNSPEDNNEHRIAVDSMSWALTAWDIDRKLRDWLKYGHEFKTADEAIEKTREFLHETLYERNISLDMIN